MERKGSTFLKILIPNIGAIIIAILSSSVFLKISKIDGTVNWREIWHLCDTYIIILLLILVSIYQIYVAIMENKANEETSKKIDYIFLNTSLKPSIQDLNSADDTIEDRNEPTKLKNIKFLPNFKRIFQELSEKQKTKVINKLKLLSNTDTAQIEKLHNVIKSSKDNAYSCRLDSNIRILFYLNPKEILVADLSIYHD